jgi:hypothetical protein
LLWAGLLAIAAAVLTFFKKRIKKNGAANLAAPRCFFKL